jgi:hypothetical protein
MSAGWTPPPILGRQRAEAAGVLGHVQLRYREHPGTEAVESEHGSIAVDQLGIDVGEAGAWARQGLEYWRPMIENIEPILAGSTLPDIPHDSVRFVEDLGLVRQNPQGGLTIAKPI